VNVDINARIVPSGQEGEVCTNMLESKCEYSECETLLVGDQTVIQCEETSCEPLEGCDRCIEADKCFLTSSPACNWFGFKYLFDLFNSEGTTIVGKPKFTMLTKDTNKGEQDYVDVYVYLFVWMWMCSMCRCSMCTCTCMCSTCMCMRLRLSMCLSMCLLLARVYGMYTIE
jgi:ATP-dependent helicase YprA (DUF1998 family)